MVEPDRLAALSSSTLFQTLSGILAALFDRKEASKRGKPKHCQNLASRNGMLNFETSGVRKIILVLHTAV